jgi:DNA-binding response OmpR family regulator
MTKIAVVEDSPDVNAAITSFCKTLRPGAIVDQFYDRESAEREIIKTNYSLIVLDIDLPPEKNAGVGIIRANILHHKTPVMIVSGLDPLLYRSIMQELDVWDYLEKPISPDGHEFVTAALRVLRSTQENLKEQGENPLTFDNSRGKASYKGKPLNLPQTAKLILQKLYEKKGAYVPYQELFEFVKTGKNSDAIRQHVKTIRDAFVDIGESPDHISVIRMKGVQWQDQE